MEVKDLRAEDIVYLITQSNEEDSCILRGEVLDIAFYWNGIESIEILWFASNESIKYDSFQIENLHDTIILIDDIYHGFLIIDKEKLEEFQSKMKMIL